MENHTFILVGAGGVGKSCIANVWCYKHREDEPNFDPTIEELHIRPFNIDDSETTIKIIDSAYQIDFDSPQNFNDDLIKSGDGFVLVYSISDRESFKIIQDRYKDIMRIVQLDKVPMVLVANKIDLKDSLQSVVLTDEGKALAHKLGIPYIECAAKNNHNLDEIFISLVRQKRKEEKNQTEVSRSRSRCLVS